MQLGASRAEQGRDEYHVDGVHDGHVHGHEHEHADDAVDKELHFESIDSSEWLDVGQQLGQRQHAKIDWLRLVQDRACHADDVVAFVATNDAVVAAGHGVLPCAEQLVDAAPSL